MVFESFVFYDVIPDKDISVVIELDGFYYDKEM
jgi:hypothetical protein